jgi:hypothetical protein
MSSCPKRNVEVLMSSVSYFILFGNKIFTEAINYNEVIQVGSTNMTGVLIKKGNLDPGTEINTQKKDDVETYRENCVVSTSQGIPETSSGKAYNSSCLALSQGACSC